MLHIFLIEKTDRSCTVFFIDCCLYLFSFVRFLLNLYKYWCLFVSCEWVSRPVAEFLVAVYLCVGL